MNVRCYMQRELRLELQEAENISIPKLCMCLGVSKEGIQYIKKVYSFIMAHVSFWFLLSNSNYNMLLCLVDLYYIYFPCSGMLRSVFKEKSRMQRFTLSNDSIMANKYFH